MIVKVDRDKPTKDVIEMTVRCLSEGGIVVYPTDTAYGLGVDAMNPEAVLRLYELKGRDEGKPTHVVVNDWQMIKELCFTNNMAKKLYRAFMPGPLTLVLKDKGIVDHHLGAGTGTLGVRIPNCNLTLNLSKQFQRPYTTCSANRSGGQTPYSIEQVKEELDLSKVDLVLDAGQLPLIKPSTLVDLTSDELRILRQGEVSEEEIALKLRF